jgi:hypothetical protein
MAHEKLIADQIRDQTGGLGLADVGSGLDQVTEILCHGLLPAEGSVAVDLPVTDMLAWPMRSLSVLGSTPISRAKVA